MEKFLPRSGPMMYRVAADLLVLIHFAFILLVLFGGLLALRWPRFAPVHLAAALWGATVEFTGWICPLTPWEQQLRRLAGQEGYTGGFIGHYLEALIYPDWLSADIQVALGVAVVLVNVVVYGFVVWRLRGR